MNKIKLLLRLILEFYRTGIVTAIEIIVWTSVENSGAYQLFWQSDYTRPFMMFVLVFIPAISVLYDYSSKEKTINKIVYELKR